MVKLLDWLSMVAWKKPRTLIIILLVLGLIIAGKVIVYQQKRNEILEQKNLSLQGDCNRSKDSLALAYELREERLNAETKATLNLMIEDYRRQLEEQRNLNRKVSISIQENEKTLRRNKEKLKLLKDEN